MLNDYYTAEGKYVEHYSSDIQDPCESAKDNKNVKYTASSYNQIITANYSGNGPPVPTEYIIYKFHNNIVIKTVKFVVSSDYIGPGVNYDSTYYEIVLRYNNKDYLLTNKIKCADGLTYNTNNNVKEIDFSYEFPYIKTLTNNVNLVLKLYSVNSPYTARILSHRIEVSYYN